MSKLILLNGPIGCGKTELTKMLKKHYRMFDRRCKDKLHDLTIDFFCIKPDEYWNIYENRDLKEQPSEHFRIKYSAYILLCERIDKPLKDDKPRFFRYGKTTADDCTICLTIREAMIYTSEILCKPTFGEDYFGVARVMSMVDGEISIDDSTGFQEELLPAIEILGQGNIIMFRIKGRGTFENDSRNFIPDDVVKNTFDVYNTGTEKEFQERVLKILNGWLDDATKKEYSL